MRWFGVELENFQFLLVRVEADVSEQRRREVTLARVRQHGEDSVARLGALAHLRRARESAAGGDVDEDSFLLRQRAAPFHRVGAGNGENAADHAGVDGVCCELRDESGLQPCIGVGLEHGIGLARRSIRVALLLRAPGDHRRVDIQTRYSKHDYKHRVPLPSSSPIASDAGRRCASILLRWFLDSWQ